MHRIIAIVLFSFNYLVVASPTPGDLIDLPSYASLAKTLLPPAFSFAVSQLKVNDTTKPEDVSVLRKSLLHVRDLVDIFSFAYPNTSTASMGNSIGGSQMRWGQIDHQDPLLVLRGDLDAGYTFLGDFQDLAHS